MPEWESIVDAFKMAGVSFIWILMVGVNTRLVAHRTDFTMPALWAFIMSTVWVVVIQEVISAGSSWALIGFPFGAAIATGIVTKLVPKQHWFKRKEIVDARTDPKR